MKNSALALLPPVWQEWVKDNVARGCEPAAMASVMECEGKFNADLARTAIREANDARFILPPARQVQPMPHIDTSANTIHTPDRTVDVMMTFASPRIVVLGNVLSDEECGALTAYTAKRLQRSPVVGDEDGTAQVITLRSSRGAMLQRGECEIVARIEARLAALARWPVEHGEGLQVLRYDRDNEYRPHYDWFDPALPGPRKHLERGGQRVGTFVLYLSDVAQGGATSFPKLGLQVQPKKGGAVFFANTDRYGDPDQQTLHAGDPVLTGTKVVATKWLRQRVYS